MLEKASKKAVGVWGLGVSQGLSVKAGVNCWETLVRPVLEYGAEIWGGSEWVEADRVQHEMGRKILGVSGKTAREVVRRVRMADTVGEKECSQTEVFGESPKNERCENYEQWKHSNRI